MVKNAPNACSIVLHTRCMLRCKMCHMWKLPPDPESLDGSAWLKVIDDLNRLMSGQGEIIFTGGEPLLEAGMFELISAAKKKGFKVGLVTNGFLLDEKKARDIVAAGVDQVSLSLDSCDRQTHDSLRGTPGAYDRAVNGLRYLKQFRRDFPVQIITVVSGENYRELLRHIRWVKDTPYVDSVYFQTIARPFFTATEDDWYHQPEFSSLWPGDIPTLCEIIEEVIRFKEMYGVVSNPRAQLELFKAYFKNPCVRVSDKTCRLGDSVLNIDHKGDIFLCCFGRPLGNVIRDDIKELWFSETAEKARCEMYACTRTCHNIVNCFFQEDERFKSINSET